MSRRRFLPVFLALAACLPSPVASQQRQTFISGGAPITVQRYGAAGGGTRAAVLLLHGSDGPTGRYEAAAQQVAAAGYHVFLVHYFDRTGARRAGLGAMSANLPSWTATARDAVTHAAAQAGVDARRIGVLGISLGGGIGLAAASQDVRIRAVVNYVGFAPGAMDAAARLPPVLVLHGSGDRVVPVSQALLIERLLKDKGTPAEVRIYPGEGHRFSAAAQADAALRINAFFNRHLN